MKGFQFRLRKFKNIFLDKNKEAVKCKHPCNLVLDFMFYESLGCYQVTQAVSLETKHPILDGDPGERYNPIVKCYIAVTNQTESYSYLGIINGNCDGIKTITNAPPASDQTLCANGLGGNNFWNVYKILQCKLAFHKIILQLSFQ